MADRASLTRKATAGHLADDVVLAVASGCDQRLAQDHAQHGPGEIDRLFLAVDRDAARAGLQPNAGDRVLAFARRIGAPLAVELGPVFLRRDLLLFGLLGLDQRRLQIGEIANSFGHGQLAFALR